VTIPASCICFIARPSRPVVQDTDAAAGVADDELACFGVGIVPDPEARCLAGHLHDPQGLEQRTGFAGATLHRTSTPTREAPWQTLILPPRAQRGGGFDGTPFVLATICQ